MTGAALDLTHGGFSALYEVPDDECGDSIRVATNREGEAAADEAFLVRRRLRILDARRRDRARRREQRLIPEHTRREDGLLVRVKRHVAVFLIKCE